jgi:hypothetical protein
VRFMDLLRCVHLAVFCGRQPRYIFE